MVLQATGARVVVGLRCSRVSGGSILAAFDKHASECRLRQLLRGGQAIALHVASSPLPPPHLQPLQP